MWLGKYPEAEERGGTVYHISSLRRVLPPFLSFLPSCPSVRQSVFFSTYFSAISSPLLGQSIVPLPLLPLFVSFLPLCPSSLCVLPPFLSVFPSCLSMRQSLSFSTYSAISSLCVGAVHSASPSLPSHLISPHEVQYFSPSLSVSLSSPSSSTNNFPH